MQSGYTTYPISFIFHTLIIHISTAHWKVLHVGQTPIRLFCTKEEKDSYLDHVYANSAAKNDSGEKKFTDDCSQGLIVVVYSIAAG